MADLRRNPLLLLALGLIGIPTALMLLGRELTDEVQSITSKFVHPLRKTRCNSTSETASMPLRDSETKDFFSEPQPWGV